MTTEQKTPEVRMTIEGHICVISLDNAAKKNAITPALMSQLSTHLTTFEDDDNLWVAIMDPAGEHTTAGLDMPKFFGPSATAKPIPKDQVNPFALHRRTTKPVISVVHGITYTIGIEMMLAGDIVIAADTARFCQLESKRGIAPLWPPGAPGCDPLESTQDVRPFDDRSGSSGGGTPAAGTGCQ